MNSERVYPAGFKGVWARIAALPNSTYIFVIVFAAFLVCIPNFSSAANLSTLLQQASILSLLSAAISLAIMSRGIDLSIGSIVSFVGVIIALLIGAGVGEILAMAIGLLAAMGFGLLNGLVVVKLKVVPFIATFGMLGVGQGIANLLSNKRALYLEPPDGSALSLIPLLQKDLFSFTFGDSVFSVNMIVVITVLVLAAFILLFKKTVLNAYIYAIGSNPEAAKLSSINVDLWNIFVYVITGFLAGIASILMLLRLNSAQPTSGEGLEFQAVVAAVLGGNLLSGGKGSLPGAVLGALVVYVVRNGLTLVGVNSNYVMIILGLVLILGMVMNDIATGGFRLGSRGGNRNGKK